MPGAGATGMLLPDTTPLEASCWLLLLAPVVLLPPDAAEIALPVPKPLLAVAAPPALLAGAVTDDPVMAALLEFWLGDDAAGFAGILPTVGGNAAEAALPEPMS